MTVSLVDVIFWCEKGREKGTYFPVFELVFKMQGGHKPGKPGILRDFSEHGKLREFCATSGKHCSKQSILVRDSNICVKQLLTGYAGSLRSQGVATLSDKCQQCGGDLLYCRSCCGMTLDEGHYYIYFFVVITYGKVSLWLWKSLENLEFFSLSLWPP